MAAAADRESGRARLRELVEAFERNEADYLRPVYNETQARTEFITPMLEAFGWDVHNRAGHPLSLREVIEEATVEVGAEQLSKRPDYELRLARQRKLFVEAKKPSVKIDRSLLAAFQTRRYGYSASLPISIVTNFHQLAVYDCKPAPFDADEPHVARIYLLGYREFLDQFDSLWNLLSREAVYTGSFDRLFAIDSTRRGAEQFDDFFLNQTRDWRQRLAVDIYANTPDLTADELNYAVQLFLSRIVFLRICEDRDIEKYETLKNLGPNDTFDALMNELRRADNFYNSGLFRLLDDDRLGLRISDEVLSDIISELYYPRSPYTFAVVETRVLGEIYEQFLGEAVTVENRAVRVVNRPEVRESGGVVPTPAYIADSIAARVVGPLIAGKSPDDLKTITVADICCGSGVFLLAAYNLLLDSYLSWYLEHDRDQHIGSKIYEVVAGQWRLTFAEKRRILVTHLRGVDIDANAVEVTQLSLLLKLIEDESALGLNDFVDRYRTAALPPLEQLIQCGNSLVSTDEWQTACGALPAVLRREVNPFNWADGFSREMEEGGFDAIIGNPPYVRIQNMVAYSPEEISYYQNDRSPYSTGHQDNFDKYALFIERAITLVKESGRIGVIVPHKFMTISSGNALRGLLSRDRLIEEIVHFGAKQVFGHSTATYTCILILNKAGNAVIRVEKSGPIEQWRYGQPGDVVEVPTAELSERPWEFANEETRSLFARMRAIHPETLSSVGEILVGLQTSADDVYVVKPTTEDNKTVTRQWNDQNWPIEREILRPFLHDVSLIPYAKPQPNAYIIFPYHIVTNTKGKTRAKLVQPDDMRRRFPLCWRYLCARRAELEDRNISGGLGAERQWYQYGRSQSLTKFNTPKIILPVLSTEPKYSYDEANILFTGGGNGPYYMIRCRDDINISEKYLLAVLNHPLSEAIVRTNTSVFRGGYYSHGKQFIEDLPIPMPDPELREQIEEQVGHLMGTFDKLAAARTPQAAKIFEREVADLHKDLNEKVKTAFALTDADMATILSVPVPT